MKTNFTPSINIIRDHDKELYYIPTPNSYRIIEQVTRSYQAGIHSFNIIGSYGTGKSAFLLAFIKSLQGKSKYFNKLTEQFNGCKRFKFLNFIGDYYSIIDTFYNYFKIKSTNQSCNIILKKLDRYYQQAEKEKSILVLIIDEFGKFLEYAANNNPEKEMFFIQQLTEYANNTDKNILFVTTLHQGFNAYSRELNIRQRQEWEKVKGRLKEITFNESIDQLLYLAGEHINNKIEPKSFNKITNTIYSSKLLTLPSDNLNQLLKKIYPFDIIACMVLTYSLQRYAQNERSLFSFLQSDDYLNIYNFNRSIHPYYNISCVYDYLIHYYYHFLFSKFNPDYIAWSLINNALIRAESMFNKNITDAAKLIKSIGLLNLFGFESLKMTKDFIIKYGKYCLGIKNTETIINELIKKKIMREIKFKNKFILFEGTDIDIDIELMKAESKINKVKDMITPLKQYFHFSYLSAKAIYYKTGTPRFFKFILSEKPEQTLLKSEVDGIVNLIFSKNTNRMQVINISKSHNEAILYGLYKNTEKIKGILFEIEKIKYVLNSVIDDRVAKRELNNLLQYQIEELNQYVISNLYKNKKNIIWIFQGEVISIKNKKMFNNFLSQICEKVYPDTPIFKNELINRNKISTSISTAKNNFLYRLVNDWDKKDFGFSKDEFPPEKTIYLTLIKQTSMQQRIEHGFILGKPSKNNTFYKLWLQCEKFLKRAKTTKKNLAELTEIISTKPFKLKQGLINFWIPIFLFIKKDDFALYSDDQYIPYITIDILKLIIKNPNKFEIKTFNIDGIKLELFNKYRQILNKQTKEKVTNTGFIDTIRPFLVFYKALPDYVKYTARLSKHTISLRNAIASAKDPEKVFFKVFPNALGYSEVMLRKS